jgi:hypothetical protein
MKPRTYDMTFCVSKCKNKCERHFSQYEFEKGRLYSMADFNCEGKGRLKQIHLKAEED